MPSPYALLQQKINLTADMYGPEADRRMIPAHSTICSSLEEPQTELDAEPTQYLIVNRVSWWHCRFKLHTLCLPVDSEVPRHGDDTQEIQVGHSCPNIF